MAGSGASSALEEGPCSQRRWRWVGPDPGDQREGAEVKVTTVWGWLGVSNDSPHRCSSKYSMKVGNFIRAVLLLTHVFIGVESTPLPGVY